MAANMGATKLWAAPSNYNGQFLIQIQVGGAWDVSSFCDPKLNTNGVVINNWAKNKKVQHAGNIAYAPFSNNSKLFEKHFDKMLVINGINCNTNGHSAGRRYNFTGSTQSGFPNLSAAFASTVQENFPIPLFINGGQFESGGVIVPTRVGKDIKTFNTLLAPNTFKNKSLLPENDLELINNFRKKRAQAALKQDHIHANKKFIEEFLVANQDFPHFKAFKQVLDSIDTKGFNVKDKLNQQILYALVGFASGVSVAADTQVNKFDTHSDHDNLHAPRLEKLNNAICFAWEIAEQLSLTNRLNLFVASDFGRTPHYNANGGKDHWPIGSTIIMKSGVDWTNRVVGKTDEFQKALKIDPVTLKVGHKNAITLEPNHVMDFARKVMGINRHPNLNAFDLRLESKPIDFSGGAYS